MLECVKATVWKTDSHKVSKFIDEAFGFDFDEKYELNAMEEVGNYCWVKYSVGFDNLSEYDLEEIDKMLRARKYTQYNTRIILNYLCDHGRLEPGDYFVDVSW
jgi:hypothetical protein